MTEPTTTLKNMLALTNEGISVLSDLNISLDKELEALKVRDIETTLEINQKKQQLLNLFNQNNLQRSEALSIAGLSNDKAGLDSLLDSNTDLQLASLFQTAWNQLESTLKTCMDANVRNEQVLLRNRQNIEQFLSVLRGKKSSNTLYNAQGSKGDFSGQSHIGKA